MSLSKKAVATALVAVVGAGAAVPVAQASTTTTTTTQTSVYHIPVNAGILANGHNEIRAKVVVQNPNPSVRDWYSRATIKKVVRKGVNNQIQKPYRSQGYRCVPVLNGSMNASVAHFTCKLQGADVPTTVTLTFHAAFKQNAG